MSKISKITLIIFIILSFTITLSFATDIDMNLSDNEEITSQTNTQRNAQAGSS